MEKEKVEEIVKKIKDNISNIEHINLVETEEFITTAPFQGHFENFFYIVVFPKGNGKYEEYDFKIDYDKYYDEDELIMKDVEDELIDLAFERWEEAGYKIIGEDEYYAIKLCEKHKEFEDRIEYMSDFLDLDCDECKCFNVVECPIETTYTTHYREKWVTRIYFPNGE